MQLRAVYPSMEDSIKRVGRNIGKRSRHMLSRIRGCYRFASDALCWAPRHRESPNPKSSSD